MLRDVANEPHTIFLSEYFEQSYLFLPAETAFSFEGHALEVDFEERTDYGQVAEERLEGRQIVRLELEYASLERFELRAKHVLEVVAVHVAFEF